VRHGEVRLASVKRGVLWERDTYFSNDFSIGRSSVCDVTCEFLAAREWVIAAAWQCFVAVSNGYDTVFGIGSAEVTFNRGRSLSFCLSDSSLSKSISLNRPIDFGCDHVRALLPEFSSYKDPVLRKIVGDVLMQDGIFDLDSEMRLQVPAQELMTRLNRVFAAHDFSCRPLFQNLQSFATCFMMLSSYLHAEGPLTVWTRSQHFNEILFNGHAECWLEGPSGLQQTESPFLSADDLWAWLGRTSADSGRELVTPRASCDYSLPCGARVHVVASPVARSGAYVSIRCHRSRSLRLRDFLNSGSLSAEYFFALQSFVVAKKNILFAGATSSGKTTLLRAIAEEISPVERLLVLEDVAELRLQRDNVVYLQTLEAGPHDAGASVNLEGLLRESLRMRPDRLVVGECRGNEAFALIQALHTGHQGSLSTVHANSAIEALQRLEALVLRAEPALGLEFARRLVRNAFDVVVFMKRCPKRKSHVSEVVDVGSLA
jgi:pilus assembly protein CpaF